jgi:hypothetical protein
VMLAVLEDAVRIFVSYAGAPRPRALQ